MTDMNTPQKSAAFLLRLNEVGVQWKGYVSAFIRAFTSDSPVPLILVSSEMDESAVQAKEFQETVVSIVRESCKASIPRIVICKERDLSDQLGSYAIICSLTRIIEDEGNYEKLEFSYFKTVITRLTSTKSNRLQETESRIFSILDYTLQPYSIGDFIFFQMGSMVVAKTAGIEDINLVILSDPKRPHADPVLRGYVTPENHHERLMGILPLIEFNPFLKSVTVFESIQEMNAYISRFAAKAVFWPSIDFLNKRIYLSYEILKMVKVFYEETGEIPEFNFSNQSGTWAKHFISEVAREFIPVTINLRSNQRFGSHRNFVRETWTAFFSKCEHSIPVKFIVMCAKSEVDAGMRSLRNVVFTKDYKTNVVQDLALIQFSAFHLGSCSGPAAMAMFLRRPHHIFNNDMTPHLKRWAGSILQAPDKELYCSFRAENQTLGVIEETPDEIWRQFERIWKTIDQNSLRT